MNPVLIGTVVFVCTSGGAMLGLWLRALLPDNHVTEATEDTVNLASGWWQR